MASHTRAHLPALRLAFIVALLGAQFAQPAAAQDADAAFAYFDRQCLQKGPDFDGTEETARAAGWTLLPAKALKTLTPFGDASDTQGWITSAEGSPLRVVVVSKGATETESVRACTVGLYGVDAKTLETSISSRLGFPPQGSEQAGELSYDRRLEADPPRLITLSFPSKAQGTAAAVASVISGHDLIPPQ